MRSNCTVFANMVRIVHDCYDWQSYEPMQNIHYLNKVVVFAHDLVAALRELRAPNK